jgi:phosphopantothenoylcysteine decarboxylase / phosphopantothenate---cysteine ligase
MARILITCGPTREPIDPVRSISNSSSGRTGLAIAREALARGHHVDLVLGPIELPPPPGARVVPVGTCAEMLAACRRLHPLAQALIGAAAVSDFRPASPLDSKRSRDQGGWTLELVPNPDILAELGARKESRVHAGFALQVEPGAAAIEKARQKLLAKNLDWIVVNGPEALGGEAGTYVLLGRTSPPEDLGRIGKEDLARRLILAVENSLKQPGSGSDKSR